MVKLQFLRIIRESITNPIFFVSYSREDTTELKHRVKALHECTGTSISPDGNWIPLTAFPNATGQDPASCEIFLMRVNCSDMKQLTNNSYCDYQPR